ncbi:MAG: hypothetical protein PVI44_13285 [Balneolaceae bacterium]|jgi:hypothetical protein
MNSTFPLFRGFLTIITIAATLQSCATTKSATNIHHPQIYISSFDRTINAAHQALTNANMKTYTEKKISKNTYVIQFYRQRYQFGANPNAKKAVSFMTKMTITEMGKKRTRINIEEDRQSDMVAGSIPDSPGKDFLKELNKLITNEAQAPQQSNASK